MPLLGTPVNRGKSLKLSQFKYRLHESALSNTKKVRAYGLRGVAFTSVSPRSEYVGPHSLGHESGQGCYTPAQRRRYTSLSLRRGAADRVH
jgi:hypothetical protein